MILTSGTTGTPKGAQRSSPDGLLAMAALIEKIPFLIPRDHDDRGSAVSFLGFLSFCDQPADRLNDGPAPSL